MAQITAAITTHNLEKYIGTFCGELFAQSFQDFEVLIYDDMSTDRTRELLREIRKKHPEKVTLLFGEKLLGNPAGSRNAILNSGAVHGKYIVFFDGDDDIEPQFLERLYNAA